MIPCVLSSFEVEIVEFVVVSSGYSNCVGVDGVWDMIGRTCVSVFIWLLGMTLLLLLVVVRNAVKIFEIILLMKTT